MTVIQPVQLVLEFPLEAALLSNLYLDLLDHLDSLALLAFANNQLLSLRKVALLAFKEYGFTVDPIVLVAPNLRTRLIEKLPVPFLLAGHTMRVIGCSGKVGLDTGSTRGKITERAIDPFVILEVELFAADATVAHT